MKIRKLGIEWGAAYMEAKPINISHGTAMFEAFVSEKNNIVIELPTDAIIEWTARGIKITIPSE